MESKTDQQLRAEAYLALGQHRFKPVTQELVESVQKDVNALLLKWLEEDTLIYHMNLPVGGVEIKLVNNKVSIQLNPL
jgi:hypothetical protein